MSICCSWKRFEHERDEQGHVVHGVDHGTFTCLIDNRECSSNADNDTCRNRNMAEVHDYPGCID